MSDTNKNQAPPSSVSFGCSSSLAYPFFSGAALQSLIALTLSLLAFSGCQPYRRQAQVNHLKLSSISPFDPNGFSETVSSGPRELAMEPNEIELTIEACRVSALQNNLALKVELLNPAISQEKITQAESAFEALFFAEVPYQTIDQPAASTLSATQTKDLGYRVGISKPFETGADVTMEFFQNRQETNNTYSILNPAYSSDMAVTIRQPLLRNAGIAANTHQIAISKIDSQITLARTRLEVIRVLAYVDRLYWQLYFAREQLAIRVFEHQLAAEQLQRAKRRVEAGVSPDIEIIRAEAGVAARTEAIVMAENELHLISRQLKHALNRGDLDIASRTQIKPLRSPTLSNWRIDPQKAIDTAMDTRMDMLEIELRIAQEALNIDFNRNQTLPLLSIDYQYAFHGLGGNNARSTEMMFSKDYEDHKVGLSLAIPLGNQGAKSQLRESILLKIQKLANKDNRKNLIRREVLDALDTFNSAVKRVQANQQRPALALRELQAEQRQFELGLRTSVEVLDAQTKLADAKLSQLESLVSYEIAKIDLAYATGTLLGATRVDFTPTMPK